MRSALYLLKPISILVIAVLVQHPLTAQLVNNGGTINIAAGAQIISAKNISNNAGTINNNGTIKLGGDLTNTASIINAAASMIHFDGTTQQTIYGSSLNAWNITMNNRTGLALTTNIALSGSLNFTSGNITTRNKRIIFSAGSSVTGIPADTSHINGYVQFDGTGSFTYPTGNDLKHQAVTVNLLTNTGGLIANYTAADAGTAPFSTTGSSTTPLISYNNKEHWIFEQAIAGAGNVIGSVTIQWEGYKDNYNTPVNERRVAHLFNNTWQNEGGFTSGTTLTGSVESNALGNWGIFTLGSVVTPLPLKWLWVNGKLDPSRKAEINWSVNEYGSLKYEVEKSQNGTDFNKLGQVAAKADGVNVYRFTEDSVLKATSFYRIKQLDKDGRSSYSSIVRIAGDASNNITAIVYPSVITSTATLSITIPSGKKVSYYITDASGRTISQHSMMLVQGTNLIPLPASKLPPGVYAIAIVDDSGRLSIPFVKQ